jgi:hypothetical protein
LEPQAVDVKAQGSPDTLERLHPAVGTNEMPSSALSTFRDLDGFQAALPACDGVNLLVTGVGAFSARLSRISLLHVRLIACEERLSRVAFMSIPPDMVRVTLPPHPDGSLMWDRIGARPREIVTHGPGHRFEERTDGPSGWSAVWLQPGILADAVRTANGAAFSVPPGEVRWRPARAVLRSLVGLHGAAIRATATRPELVAGEGAAHGLEQQIVMALAECFGSSATGRETRSARRH